MGNRIYLCMGNSGTTCKQGKRNDLDVSHPLSILPAEVWCHVFSYLSNADLSNLSVLCFEWRAFAISGFLACVERRRSCPITEIFHDVIRRFEINQILFYWELTMLWTAHSNLLTKLDFSSIYSFTDAQLRHLPPGLVSLNLSRCQISNKGLKLLPSKLKSLSIAECKRIDGSTYKDLPQTLQYLSLAWSGLKSQNQHYLKDLPHNLYILNLTGLPITNDGILYLFYNIKHTDITSDPLEQNSILRQLTFKQISIHTLFLARTFVSKTGLEGRLPPSLHTLDVRGCHRYESKTREDTLNQKIIVWTSYKRGKEDGCGLCKQISIS